jgi:hypothetical protein
LGIDVETVSRNHENYQIIDIFSEKPSHYYLNRAAIFTVSGKGIIIHAINRGMYGTE